MRVFAAAIVCSVLATLGFVSSTSQPANAIPPLQTLNLLGAVADANHPIGSNDPYTDVSIDNGVTWRPAIISRQHPWVTVAGTNAWLNCQSNDPNDTLGSCSATLPVHALFRYRFTVASDFSNATIAGHFDVDNNAYVYFNGIDLAHQVIGPIGGNVDTLVNPTSIQSLLAPGENTMYVMLDDQGGLSGINYNLTLSLNSATPMSLSAPGSVVTFDPRGGSVTPTTETVAPGAALSSVTFPTPTRTGYTFTGWYTAATGGTQATTSYASSTYPTSDLTLYARWTANSNLVTFKANDGASTLDATQSITTDVATSLQSNTFTRTGYTFTGWKDVASGAGTSYSNNQQVTLNAPLTLFAQWNPLTYNVVFDEQGGSSVADDTYQTGGSITLPAAPTKAGYTFLGWFASQNGGSALTTTYSPSGTGNLTIYAQWQSITPVNPTNNSLSVTGFPLAEMLTGACVLLLLGVAAFYAQRRFGRK